ncbi:MAG TPA: type II toxin-antitoxin system RelE/ParE family toxin [Kofleriaceae bacterium]|nr:type II toxin-antitoxin system RelE/ParE family toxin [Kofleriaceae bacterium]
MHALASREVQDARAWYAARSDDIALRFHAQLRQLFGRIRSFPRAYQLRRRHHHAPMSDFPFTVVYRVIDDEVIVIALAHQSRRPWYWRGR